MYPLSDAGIVKNVYLKAKFLDSYGYHKRTIKAMEGIEVKQIVELKIFFKI